MTSSSQLSLPRSLARLWPFVKPAVPRVIAGLIAALLATGASLLIPIVLQRVVDGPIASGDREAIVWATLGVLALGIAEAIFIFLRRMFVLRPMTEVEFEIRQTFYE